MPFFPFDTDTDTVPDTEPKSVYITSQPDLKQKRNSGRYRCRGVSVSHGKKSYLSHKLKTEGHPFGFFMMVKARFNSGPFSKKDFKPLQSPHLQHQISHLQHLNPHLHQHHSHLRIDRSTNDDVVTVDLVTFYKIFLYR